MRKIQFMLLLTFLVVAANFQTLLAVPAYPHPIEYKLPDGSIITLSIMGDEKVHWAETIDGYTILQNKDGFYVYATHDKDQNLILSNVIAHNERERSASEVDFLSSVPRKLRYSEAQVKDALSRFSTSYGSKMGGFPTTGTNNMIMILANFSNTSTTYTQTNFNNYMNQEGYNGTGSFKDYYIETSYGQLVVNTTVTIWVTLPNTHDYYGPQAKWGEFAYHAVQAADAYVDFSDFDNDGNGTVDGIAIIHQGQGREETSNTNDIWSHSWDLSSAGYSSAARTFDGVYVNAYTTQPETSASGMANIGVMCHEFGHNLGAPDYYDTNYDNYGDGYYTGTGQWDIMAGGSWNNSGATPAHHNGFTKVYYYGWANATELNTAATVTLNNASEYSNSFYRINTTTSGEFFLVENREKQLFDSYIPGSGMIIYHVHSGVFTSGNSINVTHPQKMYPVSQNATGDPSDTPSSYGTINSASCAWDGTGKIEFSDASLPSSKSWAGVNTGKPITNIIRNATEKTVTFDFMGGDVGDPISFGATAASSSQINLSWVKNNGKDVLLAFATDEVFGTPTDGVNYSAGQTIPGGGDVIYAGGNEDFSHTSLDPNTTYYYKIFSKLTSTPTWSPGTTADATTLCGTMTLPFTESFNASTLPSCWSTQNTGTGITERWSVVNSTNAGGSAYEMKAAYQSVNSGTSRLVTPALNTVGYDELNLTFKHFFDDYETGMSILIQSSNDGITWTNETWSITSGSGNTGPITVNTPIQNNLNSTSTYIAFVITGNLYQFDYWYIDDVEITGVEQPTYFLTLTSVSSEIGASLTGSGEYHEDDIVNISASTIPGFVFDGWDGNSADLALVDNATSQETFITIPDWDVSLYANYIKILTLDGLAIQNKIYDGNANAAVDTYGTLFGVMNDYPDVSLATGVATASFSDIYVANDIDVTVSGLLLTGTDAGYYTIYNQTSTANISAKELEVINSVADKVYDGTTDATITGAELSGVVGGDDVTLTNHTSGIFAQKNVGDDIEVSTTMGITGNDIANYALNQPTILADITAKDATVTAVDLMKASGASYTFDGTEFTVEGLINPDNVTSVTLASDGADAAAAVGDYDITPSNAVGSGLGNYNISYVVGTMTVTSKTELSLLDMIADSKVYDGYRDASISSWGDLSGVTGGDDVSLVEDSFVATFDTKTVGADKTVSVTGLTLSGADAGNYFIGKQTTLSDITEKQLTVTNAVAEDKTYDATAVAAISGATLSGAVIGDDVMLTDYSNGTFAQSGVGQNINIVTAMALSGADAPNYILTQPSISADINAKELALTGSFSAQNKVYDGTTSATVGTNSLTLVGVVGTEVVNVSPVASFDSKNVGTTKIVSLMESSTLTGADAGNYSLSLTGAPTATANITSKELIVVNATAEDKEYDKTTQATISGAELSGLISGDAVSLVNGDVGTFAQSTVGENISVSTTMSLSGTDAANYNLVQPTGISADITQRSIILTGNFSVLDKVYDGTVVASIDANNLTMDGLMSGDDVALEVALSFTDKNVGTGKVVSFTNETTISGDDVSNYLLSLTGAPTSTGIIFAKDVGISGTFTANSKVYDGTVSAVIASSELTILGLVEGDVVDVIPVATFSSKDVGEDKVVMLSEDSELSGADAGNYQISYENAVVTTADITPKELTVGGTFSVLSKVYDGTVDAEISENELSLNGLIENDVVALAPVAEFSDKNVGEDKVVSVVDASIEGLDAGNYTLSLDAAPTAVADITEKTVTLGGSFTVLDKEHDGNVSATIDENNLEIISLVAADVVNLNSVVAEFATSEIGDDILVSIVSASLAGADALNYSLSIEGAPTATASITQPVSVNTNPFANLEVFPNPFENTISFRNAVGLTRVVITNLIGQKVVDTKLNEESFATIETSSLRSGIYLVSLYSSNGDVVVKKMVKK